MSVLGSFFLSRWYVFNGIRFPPLAVSATLDWRVVVQKDGGCLRVKIILIVILQDRDPYN